LKLGDWIVLFCSVFCYSNLEFVLKKDIGEDLLLILPNFCICYVSASYSFFLELENNEIYSVCLCPLFSSNFEFENLKGDDV